MDDQPTTQPAPQPSFRIIAYATAAITPSLIPYDRLTHLNYAFLIPKADGTFQRLTNSWKLKEIVSRAQEKNVQVLISVGGWGWDEQFETLAADPTLREVFVRELAGFVEEYQLDGADIDWEYPDPGPSSQNYLQLMQALRQALPPGKLLTTAVAATGANGEGIPVDSFPLMDFVNLMAYDMGDEGHSLMTGAEASLDYWLGRGLPVEKTVLGVPFYARPNGIPYAKLVQADAGAAQVDEFDYYGVLVNYNGQPTIQLKTRLALERASGIMFWTLEHDSTGETSLLKTIYETVKEKQP